MISAALRLRPGGSGVAWSRKTPFQTVLLYTACTQFLRVVHQSQERTLFLNTAYSVARRPTQPGTGPGAQRRETNAVARGIFVYCGCLPKGWLFRGRTYRSCGLRGVPVALIGLLCIPHMFR